MSGQVYLNGSYVPYEKALVPVEDRGYQFADGLYEVIDVKKRTLFAMTEHLDRLTEGAGVLRIPVPLSHDEFTGVASHLIEVNGVEQGIIYIQLTRGAARRLHAFPEECQPSLVVMARTMAPPPPELYSQGCPVITVPDNRWGLCYLKTVGLLPNILARQKAKEAGTMEAVFVRDGLVTEASTSSLFAIKDGVIWTHPLANILPGITRHLVIDQCRKMGLTVREQAFTYDWMLSADELFLTATYISVHPVVTVDGHTIGTGTPGPVYKKVRSAYLELQEKSVVKGGS